LNSGGLTAFVAVEQAARWMARREVTDSKIALFAAAFSTIRWPLEVDV
jgi:hypothetical protein